jgi:hypothetical protein
MKMYKVVFEIEILADNPIDAVTEVASWLKDENNEFAFTVQDDETKEIFSIDLAEEDDDRVLQMEKYEPLIN